MEDDRLLTVQEVAERLRVNPYTVRRWLREGTLRGKLMGGRRAGYRIAESDLRRYLASNGDEGKALAVGATSIHTASVGLPGVRTHATAAAL